ncbi:MAG TPA: tRNA (adenosine(37)-N6)-threonylcarbamoyltransferase complex dimerization subunit type 1 TsaB [Bryobacteraceae bacterium]|nr:tRNA (adenosine(37)-N6)-threonylcarbamoyltransferase complex dimerization subunit type 1 TsaB [Bryobacteraceae bacterium]
MTILALDTTSEFGSLAVRTNGQTSAEIALHSPEGFAHLIFPAIDKLLAGAEIALGDIDRFAAASGPGSFTGVRVGLAAVKGLAEAMGKPAVGVSNLRALASFVNLPLRAVWLDARRGQVYAAVYNSKLKPVVPEAVLEFGVWLESLDAPEYEFIAEAKLRASLGGTRFAGMPFLEAPRNLASAVAYCAEISPGFDPAVLDANYVRRSDAELFWKDN